MISFKHRTPIPELASKTDIRLYYCGTEQCGKGHTWGPALKDHFKIHYIHSGKGIFKTENREFELSAGQCFIIHPEKLSFYMADETDPWAYYWVAFNGLNAANFIKRAGFSDDNPIINELPDNQIISAFEKMFTGSENNKCGDLIMLGGLYDFFSILIDANDTNDYDKSNSSNTYVNKAIELIELNYSSTISISEIADKIGINRKYFSKVFKDTTGSTAMDYLVNFRLNKACQLMKDQSLSIGEISNSVGYKDQLLFSRIFKRFKGLSPSAFRKNL